MTRVRYRLGWSCSWVLRVTVAIWSLILAGGCTSTRNAKNEATNGVMAFDVTLNGEQLCTAGIAANEGVVNVMLNWIRVKRVPASNGSGADSEWTEHNAVSVGGLAPDPDGTNVFLNWTERPLEVGDELRIKVIRTGVVDTPTRTREGSGDGPRSK